MYIDSCVTILGDLLRPAVWRFNTGGMLKSNVEMTSGLVSADSSKLGVLAAGWPTQVSVGLHMFQ